jgi:hypothetical protein
MTTRTLDELIEQLTDLREEIGRGDVRVRVGNQPSYPLANNISNLVCSTDLEDDEDDEDVSPEEREAYKAAHPDEFEPVVWIALDQDREDPYGAPKQIWEASRW